MIVNKVTDLTYLTELSKGDTNFVKEMIDIFLAENPAEITQLEQAIEKTDFEKIKFISHHMKSTIPFVGLDIHIGNDIYQIENLAGEKKEIETIRTHFAPIKSICQKAFQELNT
jgi:HPt (histidine-containing phosphotransfer) domain-containing protein